jgi:Arc/MetJ-type ribon-helix-helix transcriptional regulator
MAGEPIRRRRAATRGKVTVSLPHQLIAAAEERVRGGAASSFSALVADALSEMLEHERLGDLLDAMDKEYGPPSADDEAWARQVLGL